MGKAEGNNAWNTLKRLFNLTKLLTEKGRYGASWDEIRDEIYSRESDANEESLKRKFKRDRDLLMDIYDDEDILEAGDEPLDGAAIVELNKEGRYTIRSGVNLMLPMRLTEEQALAMTSSVRLVPHFIPQFKDASGRLLEKLQKQMSADLVEKCDVLTNAIVPAIPVSQAGKNPYLKDVLDAISRKKVLNVRQYQSAWPDDPRRCRFSPWTLFLRYHSWYILGEMHEEKGGKTRILRVDRIKLADVTDQDQPHPCDEAKLMRLQEDIRLDRYGHAAASMPKDGWHVKLRVTGSFAKPCMETEWFPGEKKRMQNDGSVDYEVTLKGLEAITLWIMRALDCMEVLEPVELREIIDSRVNAYMARRNAGKGGKV